MAEPFVKPKDGVVFVLDCHAYVGGAQPRLVERLQQQMRYLPIIYPKDRFCLLLFGAAETPERPAVAPGVVLAHPLQHPSEQLVALYNDLAATVAPRAEPAALADALRAAVTVFAATTRVNRRRVAFVVPPAFFDHHAVTP